MTINEPETLVRRGAELLDDKAPLWWNRVDTENFNIRSTDKCILRQVYGNYGTGLRILGLGYANAAEYGFVCGESYLLGTCICNDLTSAWIALIEEKRAHSAGR